MKRYEYESFEDYKARRATKDETTREVLWLTQFRGTYVKKRDGKLNESKTIK